MTLSVRFMTAARGAAHPIPTRRGPVDGGRLPYRWSLLAVLAAAILGDSRRYHAGVTWAALAAAESTVSRHFWRSRRRGPRPHPPARSAPADRERRCARTAALFTV